MDNGRFQNLEAPSGRPVAVNRTQALVLGFLALAWVSLVSILAVAPEVYDGAIKLPSAGRRSAPSWARSRPSSPC